MTAQIFSRRWLVALVVVAMAVALAACSGDSEPEPPEPAPAATDTAADEPEAATPETDESAQATAADAPEPAAPETDDEPAPTDDADDADDAGESAAARAEPSGEAREISVDGGTTWQDLFGGFAPAEQSCIRDALGDDLLASALSERVLAGTDSEPWQADLLSCLPDPTAEAVFFAVTVAGIEQNTGPLGADERSCLRALVADADVVEVVTAAADDAASVDFAAGMLGCLADVMLRAMLEESGVTYDDLSEEEQTCLRESLAGGELGALFGGDAAENLEAFGALLDGLFSCIPEAALGAMLEESGVAYDDLSEEERACLLELVAGGELSALFSEDAAEDPDALLEFLGALFACVPDALLIDGDFGGGAPPGDDDHANTPGDATRAMVGGSVDGVLEHGGDTDMFVFAAEAGVFYGIDVSLGTLDDSIVRLIDAGWSEVAFNDDSGGSYASRIEWQAPAAGDYYVEVSGWGPGSYTLTITTVAGLTEVAVPAGDDHADAPEGATPAAVGAPVEGTLEHAGDTDMFVFAAEAGALYRIDVGLGTLDDSIVVLLDADWWELAYNDDHGDSLASRIEWQAPESGDYYVAVWGWGPGSYTLTITVVAER